MKKRYIILGMVLISFILITILVITNNTTAFDDYIYIKLLSIKSPLFDSFFKLITKCANPLTVIILVILILLIIKDKYRYIFGITTLITLLSNTMLKHIFLRPRPDHLKLIHQGGYSYPSGHASISVAIYGFLIYYIYHKIENKRIKIVLITLLTLLILLIGLSRIYVGVHYTSDIIGGYLLATSIIIIVISVYDYYTKGELK